MVASAIQLGIGAPHGATWLPVLSIGFDIVLFVWSGRVLLLLCLLVGLVHAALAPVELSQLSPAVPVRT